MGDKDKIREHNNDDIKYCSDEDEGDEDLLNSVAQWADQKEDERHLHQATKAAVKPDSRMLKKRSLHSNKNTEQKPPYDTPYNPSASRVDSFVTGKVNKSSFSLHITNLPYSATKESIVKVFEDKGCRIASTRLVHNYHRTRRDSVINKKNQGNHTFTGVAFVDMIDKMSFRKGLSMDKMQWLDPSCSTSSKKGAKSRDSRGRFRKVNIRPTRTKEELAAIVQKTKEKLVSERAERGLIKEGNAEPKKKEKRSRDERDIARKNDNDRSPFNAKKSKKNRNERKTDCDNPQAANSTRGKKKRADKG